MPGPIDPRAEWSRLDQDRTGEAPWRRWGPYLAEREWAGVREDYSPDGRAWEYFPHDHARSRAYRWGEDGLLGISDDRGLLCFAVALWNGNDPILKERLFGLTGDEGNHGEDVKEVYFYLDSTPTHSYMKALYRYPQRAFPYEQLVHHGRDRTQPELELVDTGIFDDGRYFDVTVEYAKAAPDDVLIRVTIANRGPDAADLHFLPTIWYRNTWSWGRGSGEKPLVRVGNGPAPGTRLIHAVGQGPGESWLALEGEPGLLFTENESNAERLWGVPNKSPFVKDGIDAAVVHGDLSRVNPELLGTKAAAHYRLSISAGGEQQVLLRLSPWRNDAPFDGAPEIFEQRKAEADAFYAPYAARSSLSPVAAAVQRQAFAGLLWCKQHYLFDVAEWLEGDPACPPPPPGRHANEAWRHLHADDVISMPDSWEYPWFAAWDLAFHCVPLALIDPELAKSQLLLLTRDWYLHPNGQLPAYEWAFDDVNPPVHAWAALRVYRIERRVTGRTDRAFLERIFHKLLLNFTWWVNRKDSEGNNVFEGGFLGLDNIGLFDRSKPLPEGGHLEQADGTAWMGMFSLNMLSIALELAAEDVVYEDLAVKFFQHFLYIAGALNDIGGTGQSLWDPEDEFFYDVLHTTEGLYRRIKVRSLVGLIPLLAVDTIEPALLERLPYFAQRMEWFLAERPDLAGLVSHWQEPGMGQRRLLALARGSRMKRLLRRMLDPNEFLSDHGIRSVSRYHLDHPCEMWVDGTSYTVRYEPAESHSSLFGGNSNWRGPVWWPINFLLIEAIQRFHYYYGDDFRVEHPTGSGITATLWEIAADLSRRLSRTFLPGADGRRPVFGARELFQTGADWHDLVPFYEYFNGDTGEGLGASHQTGWTALVAKLLEQSGE